MIALESSIGFALAFLLVTWSASLLVCGLVLAARGPLSRRGPATERAAARAALVLAPLVGLVIVLATGAHSLTALWPGAVDHCAQHGHHPHLCWVHGAGWAGDPLGVVPLAMFAAYFLVRVAQRAAARWSAARALEQIARVARPDPGGVLIAPSDRIFCFAAGAARPRVYVSSAAWAALREDERRAVVAHERAHLAQGDLSAGSWLGVLALVGAPIVAQRVLGLWRGATERLCDLRAADEVDATTVASALVALTRAGGAAPAGLAFASPAGVVERVEALLAGVPAGTAAARRVTLGLSFLVTSLAALAALFADPLHHALETLLGVF